MPKAKSFLRIIPVFVGLAFLGSGLAKHLPAQNKPAAPVIASEKFSDQEKRGEGLFLQRCSICHLPRNLKFGAPPTAGPSLAGLFKAASPADLKVLRGIILKGSPNMPGFQYGLESNQVDDLIAFLKTL